MGDRIKNTIPPYRFTPDPTVSEYEVPYETYIATHRQSPSPHPHAHPESGSHHQYQYPYQYIATGALIFDPPLSIEPTPASGDKILLIQRAAHDSMPHLWEVPGGACDAGDATILHSVAREVWEETGLVASRIGPQVGPKQGQVFRTRSGKGVCKFHFVVDVDMGCETLMSVRLDPNEHQAYVWADEEQVKAGRVGVVEVKFTTAQQEEVVLEGFRVRRAMKMRRKIGELIDGEGIRQE